MKSVLKHLLSTTYRHSIQVASIMTIFVLYLIIIQVSCFQNINPSYQHSFKLKNHQQHTFRYEYTRQRLPHHLHSQKESNSKKSPAAGGGGINSVQFELQELRAQLNAIQNAKLSPRMLQPSKRSELENYIQTILSKCASPIPLRSIGDDNAKILHGTWRLTYSSEGATLGDLPREANVFLKIYPDYKCDYVLQFSEKVWGLKSITAKSTYMVDCSPVNPGLVTFIYQDIVTDVMGIQGLPVAFFGLLKGRANYVESIWMDGKIWIERGYSPEGLQFYNVYLKTEE